MLQDECSRSQAGNGRFLYGRKCTNAQQYNPVSWPGQGMLPAKGSGFPCSYLVHCRYMRTVLDALCSL